MKSLALTACLLIGALVACNAAISTREALEIFDELPSLLQIKSQTRVGEPEAQRPAVPKLDLTAHQVAKKGEQVAPAQTTAAPTTTARGTPSDKKGPITVHTEIDMAVLTAPVPTEFKDKFWAEVKHGSDRAFLERYGAFRKALVDALLVKVMKEVKCNTCKALSVGSMSPTSDYDLTVSGPQSDNIVKTFNSQFEAIMGKTAAEAFDTNIYGIGWLDDQTSWGTTEVPCYKRMPPLPAHRISPFPRSEERAADTKDQNVFALSKLMYFARKAYAALYPDPKTKHGVGCNTPYDPVEEVEGSWPCQGIKSWTLGMPRVFKGNPESLKAFEAEWKEARALVKSVLTEPCKAHPNFCVATNGEPIFDMKNTKGRNTLYEEKLAKIYQFLRTKPAGGVVPPNACQQCKHDISEAMVYGMETYWTEGTFLDVVTRQQTASIEEIYAQVPITFAQYFNSFLENAADLCKVLEEGVHEHWDTEQTTIEGSKYAFRAVLVANILFADPSLATTAFTARLRNLVAKGKAAEQPTLQAPSALQPNRGPGGTAEDPQTYTKGAQQQDDPEAVFVKVRQDIVAAVDCLKGVAEELKAKVRGKPENDEAVQQIKTKCLHQLGQCYHMATHATLSGLSTDDIATARMAKMVMSNPATVPLSTVINLAKHVIAYYYININRAQALVKSSEKVAVDEEMSMVLDTAREARIMTARGVDPKHPSALRRSVESWASPQPQPQRGPDGKPVLAPLKTANGAPPTGQNAGLPPVRSPVQQQSPVQSPVQSPTSSGTPKLPPIKK